MTKEEWYVNHECDHAHCPYKCEHPQPFMIENDLVCGRCWFIDGETIKMNPCKPEVCD